MKIKQMHQKNMVKKFKVIFTLLAFLPFAALAQNCNYNINYGCWFTQQTSISSLAWSPDGNKLAFSHGGTFCSNTSDNLVLNMGPGIVSVNTTLTKNYSASSLEIFGPTGGLFSGSYYVKPSGTAVSSTLGYAYRGSTVASVDKDTVVYVAYTGNGSGGATSFLCYANVSDPENPVFTKITPPVGSPLNNSVVTTLANGEAIATAGNRIYFAQTDGNVNNPTVIKCVDFAGNTCPNWSNVSISTGEVYDMGIRPTDGKIFIRGNLKTGQPAQPGLVILNPNGTLATGFNHTDLSLITAYPNYLNGGGKFLVRFDSDGNIFANMPLETGGTHHGIGMYKFDPNGNLDLDFMRNVTNSYIFPGATKASYFDVNQVTGELAIALYNGGLGDNHALNGGEHKHTNNEAWETAFQSIGGGDGAATTGARASSGYETLHILYNNGKLKVQGESTATQTANCGTKTPTVVPNKDPGIGTIQCSGLSFMAAPVAGTPSTLVVKIPVNVTTPGIFKPVTVSGSGMSMQDPYTTFTTNTVGINDFYLTLKYDGSALGMFSVSVGGAGSCTADLTDQTKNNPSIINIWTPENCTYKVIGPDLK
ncbi:hypothetical protein F0919_11510 [Taibaiella lutea]|uniref:Uncharacterized protein n=1 Tax=Taibaiella lutea TaxID=2608001 RepID=A0A5M6CJ97_9BACT|nr:hypothetical protein [Taibaiella lutea]KAA5533169.1 hypothetical protein F0919_11510 [Taibaiella lutea]